MVLKDILFLSFRSVRGNRLRSRLTIAIIAIGIMALVGIFTAVASIRANIYNNFASMGANGFTIRNWQMNIHIGGGRKAEKGNKNEDKKKVKTSQRNSPITYLEAMAFTQRYPFPSKVSVSVNGGWMSTVFHQDKKTDPNVRIVGSDDNYLALNGYDLDIGRNFSQLDLESGRNVAILGMDVAKKLFGDNLKHVEDNTVRLGTVRYRVIGVLKSKGSSNLFSGDNMVLTTINNVRRVFSNSDPSYQIGVKVDQVQQLDEAIGEATGLFRIIRKLNVDEENNFYISKSDNIAEMLMGSLSKVKIAAIFIGFITLFGSAIGLMNIMLVAVAERTREIGVSKALGAKSIVIRRQFLYEALIISLWGGALGIILGIILGNVVSLLMGTHFVVPWNMIIIGVIICTVVGIISGIYPAIKASKLNPINALRYE
jgi:putative ABC transport system permease protein